MSSYTDSLTMLLIEIDSISFPVECNIFFRYINAIKLNFFQFINYNRSQEFIFKIFWLKISPINFQIVKGITPLSE